MKSDIKPNECRKLLRGTRNMKQNECRKLFRHREGSLDIKTK